METIFDAHFHIIDSSFPLIDNKGYMPPEFTIDDYKKVAINLNIKGGIVVSGSYHGYDQEYLLHSLKNLGDNFAGITQLAVNTTDKHILELNEINVKGIRFNIKRLDPISKKDIAKLAKRVFNLAEWHSEFYIESAALENYFELLSGLPMVSIDHLGLTHKGFDLLLELAAQGVKVKATGFGRLDFDPLKAMKEIYTANPDSLMFGTDLPSTRAERPFNVNDIKLIQDNFNPEEREKIFYGNAADFYRLKPGKQN